MGPNIQNLSPETLALLMSFLAKQLNGTPVQKKDGKDICTLIA